MGIDLKALDRAFGKIEKASSGTIVDLKTYSKITRVVTRSPALNKVLGGGLPSGMIEGFGEFSVGKSLLAYVIGGAYQDIGEMVFYIDAEHSFDEEFANKQGLDTSSDKFRLIRPETVTDAFTIIEDLLELGAKCIIFDSVASSMTREELDGDYNKALMGVKARALSRGLLKLTPIVSKKEALIYFINQTRKDLSVTYGDNNVSTGGKSLPFYSKIRLKIQRVEYIKEAEEPIGFRMKITTVKNKTYSPNKKCELVFYYESGLDTITDVITLFVEKELLLKGGGGNYSFYDVDDQEVKIRGLKNVIDYFKDNEKLFEIYKSKAGLTTSEELDTIEE